MVQSSKTWWAGVMAAVALAGCGPQDAGDAEAGAAEVDVATTEAALSAEPTVLYAGLFRAGSGGHALVPGLSLNGLVAKADELEASGFRLEDVDVELRENGTLNVSGVWRPGSGNQVVRVDRTLEQLQSDAASYAAQGLALADVEVYSAGDAKRTVAVYRPGPAQQKLVVGTWSAFESAWTTESGNGLRLVNLETYVDAGARRFLGVFHTGSGGHGMLVGVTATQLRDNTDAAEAQGLRLVDVTVYWENGAWRYAGVYRAGAGGQELVLGNSWSTFNDAWTAHSNAGLRLVSLKSYQAPSWKRELEQHFTGAMGFSYAVVEGGTITSSGGVGYARAPSEALLPGLAMTASTRVHLASVSKPITAVAFMELTEQYPGVDLDDPFYPYVDDLYPNHGTGVENVTLRQLLTHTSGMPEWGYCGDIFPAQMAQLIASDLVGTPGVTAQYSNGNYCLVRAVIERVSGMSYVDFVKTHVLQPMGITGMSCKPDLTLYYAKNASGNGYTWTNDYTSQCAAYGWYGSATDMAKFLVGVRNNTVLGWLTTAQMNAGRIGWWDATTAGGTALHHNGAWVTGDGRGSNTGIIRLPNGVEAVVLSNTAGYDTISVLREGYRVGPYAAE